MRKILIFYRTKERHRLTQKQIVFPFILGGELSPRTDRMEVIFDHGKTFTVANNVVMSRNDVEANVILLTAITMI